MNSVFRTARIPVLDTSIDPNYIGINALKFKHLNEEK